MIEDIEFPSNGSKHKFLHLGAHTLAIISFIYFNNNNKN